MRQLYFPILALLLAAGTAVGQNGCIGCEAETRIVELNQTQCTRTVVSIYAQLDGSCTAQCEPNKPCKFDIRITMFASAACGNALRFERTGVSTVGGSGSPSGTTWGAWEPLTAPQGSTGTGKLKVATPCGTCAEYQAIETMPGSPPTVTVLVHVQAICTTCQEPV